MKALPPDNTTTESEAYLAGLCRRTFLRLWSYPGLYQDKGKGKTGHGKELCDLLVVFGDDVIVFSDKDCELLLDPTPEVGWSRWYKKAVLEAAKQIIGAERWLTNNPGRVFLDRECRERIPISLPAKPRFHRIVTCRGAAQTSLSVFGGNGSLIVTNERMDACASRPLHLGAIDDEGRIFHVVDEVALDALLKTFDTVSDLCTYLTDREEFFRGYRGVVAAGEEELVAYYLRHYSEERQRHHFKVADAGDGSKATHVIIDEGYWDEWLASKHRAAKLEADTISYCWDRLADKFAFHMLTETQHFTLHPDVRENEIALRMMAREPRVRRRMLARALIESMEQTGVGQMRRRMILPSRPGDPHWVFLVLPRTPDLPLERYRTLRYKMLEALARVAKHVRPEALDIVGIAVEPNPDEISEDLLYLDARVWTPELAADAADLHAKTGFFTSEAEDYGTEHEFPVGDAGDREER